MIRILNESRVGFTRKESDSGPGIEQGSLVGVWETCLVSVLIDHWLDEMNG